jgi:polysaccharide biosynthesis protein PslH
MKIVFIVSRFPYPLEKGDKLRAFQHIVNLKSLGHEVHLVALSDVPVTDQDQSYLKSYCSSIRIFSFNKAQLALNLFRSFSLRIPFQVAYFFDPEYRLQIEKHIYSVSPDIVYCQLIRTILYAEHIKNIPCVVDYQDAFGTGMRQRAVKAPFWLKSVFTREYELIGEFESRSWSWFNRHFVISQTDRHGLNVPDNVNIEILPNGIDTTFFQPKTSEHRYDITFVGNMNYPPNVDAAIFLVNDVMPLVWRVHPSASVQIAGASPHRNVKSLAGPRVTVTGWVDDIRDCYSNSKIFIAPMRTGTGLQNKLLEAMAMRMACVTTPISFVPLGADEGVHLLVGSDARSLAEGLIRLMSDDKYRDQVASQGHDFVVEKYSMHHSREALSLIFEKVYLEAKNRKP